MSDDAGDPIELHRARGPVEAYALHDLLGQAGIPSHIDNDALQGVVGEVPGGWVTALRVLVGENYIEAAQAVLADFLSQESNSPRAIGATDELACLACRTPMASADTCPKCGWSYGSSDEPTTTSEETLPQDSPTETPVIEPTITGDRPRWGEVAAVLAVGVVPYLNTVVQERLITVPTATEPIANLFVADALNMLVVTSVASFVTLYLIHRSGEPWARFGLVAIRGADFPLGFGMLLLAVASVMCQAMFVRRSGSSNIWFASPQGPAEIFLMIVMLGVAAFSEELVTRAYLISRLEVLLESRGKAVVLAAIAFSSYHAYQGAAGVVGTFLMGLTFGAAYLGLRRIWPFVIGHALYNIILELAVRPS